MRRRRIRRVRPSHAVGSGDTIPRLWIHKAGRVESGVRVRSASVPDRLTGQATTSTVCLTQATSQNVPLPHASYFGNCQRHDQVMDHKGCDACSVRLLRHLLKRSRLGAALVCAALFYTICLYDIHTVAQLYSGRASRIGSDNAPAYYSARCRPYLICPLTHQDVIQMATPTATFHHHLPNSTIPQ